MVGIFDGLNHVLSLVLSYAFAISIVATLFAPIPYNSLPITLKLYIASLAASTVWAMPAALRSLLKSWR